MKKIIIASLVLLALSALPLHTIEAKTKKVKRIQKTKIIKCSPVVTTWSLPGSNIGCTQA